MMFISMWRQGPLHCLLAGDPSRRTFELRLIDGTHVIRQQSPNSSEEAVVLARTWQNEALPVSPPSASPTFHPI